MSIDVKNGISHRGRAIQALSETLRGRLDGAQGQDDIGHGCAGFIASHLAEELLRRGNRVVGSTIYPQEEGSS